MSRRRPAGPDEASNLRHQDGIRCKPSAGSNVDTVSARGRIPKSIQDAYAAAY